jgi:hypothetical protein
MPPALTAPRHRPSIARPGLRLCAGLALSLVLAACVASDGARSADVARPQAALPTAPSRAADLQAAIRAEIGQPRCASDSQCRSLPVGHKACGGPEGHLPWSSAVSDEARLLALAREQADLRRQEVQARGLMSNCQMLADPGAVCRQGLCVLAEPGAAGGSGPGSGADPAR